MYYNYQEIYKNSYLHFCRTKEVKNLSNNQMIEVYVYALDKRFTLTNNVDVIQGVFSKCKVKDLDEYYYIIYSLFPLSKDKYFYILEEKSIILNINDFIEMFEGRRL